MKKNLQGNAYGQQSKAPFTPTSRKVQKGNVPATNKKSPKN